MQGAFSVKGEDLVRVEPFPFLPLDLDVAVDDVDAVCDVREALLCHVNIVSMSWCGSEI